MLRRHVTRALLFSVVLGLLAVPAAAAGRAPQASGWEQLVARIACWFERGGLSAIFGNDGPDIDPNGRPTSAVPGPPNGGLTALWGATGPDIDPDGRPASGATAGGDDSSSIDPSGHPR